MGNNLQQMTKESEGLCLNENLDPRGLSAPVLGPCTRISMILKHGMVHHRLKVFKVYINVDPGFDLDLFYGKVIFGFLCI